MIKKLIGKAMGKWSASEFLSLSSIIILFGYITYNESGSYSPTEKDAISDPGVIIMDYSNDDEVHFVAKSFDIPRDLSFAGEPVPLEEPDVFERLDKELQINTYFHSNTIFLIKRANRWLPQMEKILEKHGIPEDFKYLPLIESNLLNAISPKEAVGYWQILKGSGRELGLEITSEVDERYDPLKATEAACKYLLQAYKRFGNWTLVAASYNRGIHGMQQAIDNQKVTTYYDLYLNEETSRYVFRMLAIKEIMSNPSKYGFVIKREHLYEPEQLEYVKVDETIKDLVQFSKDHGTNYKLLKRHNPWLREDKLTVRKGKIYHIAIPV